MNKKLNLIVVFSAFIISMVSACELYKDKQNKMMQDAVELQSSYLEYVEITGDNISIQDFYCQVNDIPTWSEFELEYTRKYGTTPSYDDYLNSCKIKEINHE